MKEKTVKPQKKKLGFVLVFSAFVLVGCSISLKTQVEEHTKEFPWSSNAKSVNWDVSSPISLVELTGSNENFFTVEGPGIGNDVTATIKLPGGEMVDGPTWNFVTAEAFFDEVVESIKLQTTGMENEAEWMNYIDLFVDQFGGDRASIDEWIAGLSVGDDASGPRYFNGKARPGFEPSIMILPRKCCGDPLSVVIQWQFDLT